MDCESRAWSLRLASDPCQLTTLRDFLEAVCAGGGLDADVTGAIVLATHEAVQNIIRHAHRNDPQASVEIQCRLSTGQFEVLLLDEGAPFDLEAVPALNPGELRVGGRGVFLMRSLMDEVSCQALGERGNCLRMVKHYRPAADSRNAG